MTYSSFSAFNGSTQFFTPTTDQATLDSNGVAKVVVGNTTLYIGTHQSSANNQNPIITRFTNGVRDWVISDYETGGADGRGVGLLWNGGTELYAAFTIDGTQNPSLNALTANGWQTNYGSGGGPKVAVLVKLDPATGTQGSGTAAVGTGTYILAKLSSGNTNTIAPLGLSFDASNNVVLEAESFFSPLDTTKNTMELTSSGQSSPFPYRITFNPSLSTALTTVAEFWDTSFITLEDSPEIFTADSFGNLYKTGQGEAPLTTLTITSLPSGGSLQLNGAAVTVNQVIGAAAIANLRYQPANDATGLVTFGARASNGGVQGDRSVTVRLDLTPVNDAPSFALMAAPNQSQGVGSGVTLANFATGISAGPANEAGQSLAFTVTTTNPGLFSQAPSLSPTGTLTYSLGNTTGTATVTVVLQDNGGTAYGGSDTSGSQTFTIAALSTPPPANTPPQIQPPSGSIPLPIAPTGGTVVTTLVVTDADNDPLTFSLVGDDFDRDQDTIPAFSINPQGQILVEDADDLALITETEVNLQVQVTDSLASDGVTLTLQRSPVEPPPVEPPPVEPPPVEPPPNPVTPSPEAIAPGFALGTQTQPIPGSSGSRTTLRTFGVGGSGLPNTSLPSTSLPSTGLPSPSTAAHQVSLRVTVAGLPNTPHTHEVVLFRVDDGTGAVNGQTLVPGDAASRSAYLQAILQGDRIQGSLSVLASQNPGGLPGGFDWGQFSQVLALGEGSQLGVMLVQDGTVDELRQGLGRSVFFSQGDEIEVASGFSETQFTLNFDDDGDGQFNNLSLRFSRGTSGTLDQLQRQGFGLQPQGQEVLDLRTLAENLTAQVTVQIEASFSNTVGFYRTNDQGDVLNAQGAVVAQLSQGAQAYGDGLIRYRLTELDFNQSGDRTLSLPGGFLLAPFLIADGTPTNFQVDRLYHRFIAGNSDGSDHIRLLGNNTFGFEDLPQGGDRDFDDMIVQFKVG